MDVNYRETLIVVAEDSPVQSSVIPLPRGNKKTLPQIQYELLKDHPYRYTSAEVIFESYLRHKGITATGAKKRELWEQFFSKPQPCLRASGLPKKYGWGIHCNEDGKVALYPMESAEYRRLSKAKTGILKALRSSKG
ncbi:MAG: DUF6157 family protein [Bdellovibrionota bacterium]